MHSTTRSAPRDSTWFGIRHSPAATLSARTRTGRRSKLCRLSFDTLLTLIARRSMSRGGQNTIHRESPRRKQDCDLLWPARLNRCMTNEIPGFGTAKSRKRTHSPRRRSRPPHKTHQIRSLNVCSHWHVVWCKNENGFQVSGVRIKSVASFLI